MISHRQNKKLKIYPSGTKKPAKASGGRPEAYPWTEWFDGKTRKLIRGTTYHCSDRSMQKSIYAAATRRAFPVTIQVTEDALIISPKKIPDPSTAKVVAET